MSLYSLHTHNSITPPAQFRDLDVGSVAIAMRVLDPFPCSLGKFDLDEEQVR